MSASPTAFGVPLVLRQQEALEIREAVRAAWLAVFSRDPGEFQADLELLRRFFNPIAQGHRLRQELAKLGEFPVPELPEYAERLFIPLSKGRRLVTPEARAVLECVERSQAVGDNTVLRPDVVSSLERELLSYYSILSQQRIRSVAQLSTAPRQQLHPLGLGVLLFLLVNRSTARERAIRRPPRARREERHQASALDDAIAAAAAAFVDRLVPALRYRRQEISLYGGWQLTEARRRLSALLSPEPDLIYIRDGQEEAVLEFVASELRRRGAVRGDWRGAFDALVSSYRTTLPVLANLGVAHERPSFTEKVRDRISSRLEKNA